MGFADSKTRIIEFYGLPGAGKTTISDLLGDFIEKQYGPVYKQYNRNRFEAYTYSMCLSPRFFGRFIRYNQYSHKFDTARSLRYSLLPLRFIRMYEHFIKDKECGTLVIDQGFIQSVISLAHTDVFPERERLLSLIKTSGLNDLPIVIVNCKCGLEKTIERLANRQSQGSRLQLMDMRRLQDAMRVQEQNISTLQSMIAEACPNIKSISIDAERVPEYNAKLIIDSL